MNRMILDGGMGHLLKEWGVRTDGLPYEQQFLAGVMANMSDPETVKRAHRCYVTAGAGCITTNNFAATRHNLAKVQMQTAATELVQVSSTTILTGAKAQMSIQLIQKWCLILSSMKL